MKVILCQIPNLHIGYLGFYGNDWISTPTMDWLASEGIVFDHHFADHISPIPSFLTGKFHFSGLAPGQESSASTGASLEEILSQNGLILEKKEMEDHDLEEEVGKILGGVDWSQSGLLWLRFPSLAPPWEIPETFLELFFSPSYDTESNESESDQFESEELEESEPEEFESEEFEPEDEEFESEEYELENEESELEDFEAEESELEDEELPELFPLFEPEACVPEQQTDLFLEKLQFTYAAKVCQIDSALGRLVDYLEEHSVLEEVLIILTSEAGLSLGERGEVGSNVSGLHEEVIHLPLLFRLPQRKQAGRRVAALTQTIDLYPTLLQTFSLPCPDSQGHNLWPLIEGNSKPLREYIVAGCFDALENVEKWALRTPEWALLTTGSSQEDNQEPRLFVKPDDRWEVNDVLQLHLDWADQLEQTRAQFVRACGARGPFTPPPLPQLAEVGDSEDASHS